ncbi:uncharacterized protein isoform X2 [Musca autumnalis]|uniref:uncharacterized protein isoform X2 n=1 Tax=Musca autumnalis TaxID=221902 RepID=UPI003CF988A4
MESSELEMLRSTRGKDMLHLDGYLYYYHDVTSKSYRWLCSRRKGGRTPCRVRIHTTLIDEWDMSRHKLECIVGEHPHGPEREEIITRGREKKQQANSEGLPCTISNRALERKLKLQQISGTSGGNKTKNIQIVQNTHEEKEVASLAKEEEEASKSSRDSDDDNEDNYEDHSVHSFNVDDFIEMNLLGSQEEEPKVKRSTETKSFEKKILVLKTAKGCHMVALDGCVYRLDAKSQQSSTYRWKCFRSKDVQCSGRIYTECLSSGLHRYKPFRLEENQHNHQPYSEAKIQALGRRKNIRIIQDGKKDLQQKRVLKQKTNTTKDRKPKKPPLPGKVLSISTNIELATKPFEPRIPRKEKTAAVAAFYRYVEDPMEVLKNPQDGEIKLFSFLPSIHGNRVLIMEDMIYHFNSKGVGNKSTSIYWTCLFRRNIKIRCKCRITTENDGENIQIVRVSGQHSHTNNHRHKIEKRLKVHVKAIEDESGAEESYDNERNSEESDNGDGAYDDNDNVIDHEESRCDSKSPDISEFLKFKNIKKDNHDEVAMEITEDVGDAKEPLTDYMNERDPFCDIVENVAMEVNSGATEELDSKNPTQLNHVEEQNKTTMDTEEIINEDHNNFDADDDDYSPPTKIPKFTVLPRKPYSVESPNNPDNLDITKFTKLRSAKGGELLCVDGYIYSLRSISSTTSRAVWVCIKANNRLLKCQSRVTTIPTGGADDNQLQISRISNSHTHPVSEEDIKRRLCNEFTKSSGLTLNPKDIMNKPLSELNPELAAMLEGKSLTGTSQSFVGSREKYAKINMKLYAVSDGPPSLAVRMCLKALEIPYELHNVDYIASEHLSEEYAKMNPQKEIPVLDDDGFYLSESIAIMQYLCDKYAADSSLYPKDPKERALVNHRLCFNMAFYYSSIGAYSMAPIFFDYQRTEMGKKKVENVLQVFETYLKRLGTKYAAGDKLTIADFALVSATLCLEGIAYDFSKYELVSKWYQTFKKEYPQLWEIANGGMQEITEFEHSPPDLSHMNHPFHPTRKSKA